MYDSSDIATAIKLCAKEKGYTIKTMLSDCGMGSNTMSAMYHGKAPSAASVAKIADYLGCSVDSLLGRDVKHEKSPGMEDSMLRDEQERELIRIARELDPVQKAWLLRLVETAVEREGTRRSQASLDAVRG